MERFGRYELLRKIATGGMAEIYLARQAGIEGFEKLLVLKRILPHLAENEEFVEMFLHEARVAVRLNHPNVVQIFDLGEADGAFFIAMEYIHGEDARRIWRQSELVGNPIPVPLVCRIVMDAAAGLDYAHKRTDASGAPLRIIHRDVSPQNLLVSFEGAVKVVDFGIAKAADQATQTRSGVLKGKYSYMSPEQASGKEIDNRTDQFALGIVFYELLTLRRLFKRSNDIQTLTAVSECKVAPPSGLNSRIPEGLDAIVMKALARNPNDRYRDLSEMQMAIEEWLLVNQQPSSPSHLAAFLKAIYADRLAKEQEVGTPVFQDPSEPSSSVSARQSPRRRTGLSAVGQPSLGERTRAARRGSRLGGSLVGKPATYSAPPLAGNEDDDEPTPVEPEPITGSSVSRLVSRMSGRKKAALGALGVAVLAAAAGVLLLQPQGRTVTTRPGGEAPQPVAEAPQVAAPRYAGLKIVTTPVGASVVVDGKRQEEPTPLTVAGLELGVHQVFIEHKGYLDEQRAVKLDEEGTIVPLNLELRADPKQLLVRLVVETEPPGAEVILDGQRLGPAPISRMVRANRTAQLEVTRGGYKLLREEVLLGAGPEKKLVFTLEALGHQSSRQPSGPATVSLDCDPPASIWEGKTYLGQTPFRGQLSPGRHRLTLVNRDLGFERTVPLVLEAGETVARSFRLDQGDVLIVATPWADVFLRGKKVGTTPMPKMTLYEGEHQFTLVNTDLGKKKSVLVMVKPGRLEKMTVDMAAE